MSPSQRISSFTPSNTDPEILERIFVQRQVMLSKLVKRLERGITKGNKHHILMIGPRGSGKTHFITLVQHRLLQNTQLMDKVRIAWLGEDTVYTGLIDLALEISEQLTNAYPTEFNRDVRPSVQSLSPDDAAEAILKDIVRHLGQCTLLILMENLDRAFTGLGDTGQKKWRAFLQETGRTATLATSQQLFDGVSKRGEAFFGFFDIHHLEVLSASEAIQLIANVALEYGNHELVTFLGTHEGNYRVRALRHLAGGNHRMYILLSEFITKESLDDLITAFEQLAEELTPYFQERIQSLPPQQARIVQCLCNAHGAMTVKLVAETTFIPERNCSKQLGELKKKYYVTSTKRGKESYYEMAEPIMRLCLEVKNQRGRPLRLIAMFLRAWFPAESLHVQGDRIETRAGRYCAYALEMDNTFAKEIRQELDREIEGKLGCKQFDDALALAKELTCTDRAYGLSKEAYVGKCSGQTEVELVSLTKLIELPDAPTDQRAEALLYRGVTYGKQENIAQELADYTSLIEMSDAPADQRAKALLYRGITYGQQEDFPQALADYTSLIEMADAPADQRAKALLYRGNTYGKQEDFPQALADYTSLIEMADAPADQRANALLGRSVIYVQQENFAQELADYTSLIEMSDAPADQRAMALLGRGITYEQQEGFPQALADYTSLIEMSDAPADQRAKALLYRGDTYGKQEDFPQALSDYTSLIEMPDAPTDQRTKALLNRGITYGQQEDFAQALADYTSLIEMSDAPADQRAIALLVRGVIYLQQEDFARALADNTSLIEMSDAPADQRAKALLYRGFTYGQQEDFAQALADFTSLIEITDTPAYQRTMALLGRGFTYGKQENFARALSDYTSLIEMSDAPADQRAMALLSRGGTYGQQEDFARALADFTSLIEMADAPADQRAMALLNRGSTYWHKKKFEQSINDYSKVLENTDLPKLTRGKVLFCLPEAMIAVRSQSDAMEALVHAFEAGDPTEDSYGGTPHDLLKVVLMQGHSSWSDYISDLVSIYVKYKACGKLGNGLTRAIEYLDTGEYSEAQLEIWNGAWQKAGKAIEELEIPLQSLDCAIQAIKTKSDRPLFALPLEIRKLVIPLLHRTLGP